MEADAVQKMEDSSQELLFASAEVKRTDWLTCDKTMKGTELPQTTFRSSLQTTLCCIKWKYFLW
jgi:hypothetical protein